MLNKNVIDEAFEFYNIDFHFKEKCYKFLEEINSHEKMKLSYYNICKILYEKEFQEVEKLWDFKNSNKLFIDEINPFVTNMVILLGYLYHKRNMKIYNIDQHQITIHKKRVKECFENDIIYRKYKGVRISQMLWAVYFIRIRIIEIGSLQFEYKNNLIIKIHIPKKTNLSITEVKNSIKKSKDAIRKIYKINEFNYICDSWLLSNQIQEIITKNTNIYQFHDLFDVKNGKDCVLDILNFVFEMEKCDDYSLLPTNTTLQKKVKEQLLLNKKFYLGIGVLKPDIFKEEK